MSCEYVKQFYGVPAEIGRRIVFRGRPGIIAEDRGHYIGVNFDNDKPGEIYNVHPTDEVEYQGTGIIRKPSKSQQRYRRYLEYGDCFDSFLDYCRWDAAPERSWNVGSV